MPNHLLYHHLHRLRYQLTPPAVPPHPGTGWSPPTPPPVPPPVPPGGYYWPPPVPPAGYPSGGGGSGGPGAPYYAAPSRPSNKKVFTMKPDIKLFKALKEDSDYFKWEKHTHAMMGGTDMGELIDPNFVPHPDDAQSFRNKCRWLYAIFDNLVHTAEGREII